MRLGLCYVMSLIIGIFCGCGIARVFNGGVISLIIAISTGIGWVLSAIELERISQQNVEVKAKS